MIRIIVLIVWFFVVLLLKVPSWVSFFLTLCIICMAGLSIVIDSQGFALRLTTYAFGIITIGCISYILEIKKQSHEKK